jgi:hypothetical protein
VEGSEALLISSSLSMITVSGEGGVAGWACDEGSSSGGMRVGVVAVCSDVAVGQAAVWRGST